MNTELFSGKAAAYAAARPRYPAVAIEYILSLAPTNAVFADIGAGTGIFTAEIAKRGFDIFAVEPNADMLSQLTPLMQEFPNAKVVSASAEETTLPDKSVDVITCAQSLHWFDPFAFAAECRRIGKRNHCTVIAIYNNTPGGSSVSHSKNAETFFKNSTVREFPNPIRYTREKWLTYMTSHSHDPLPSDPNYDSHIAEMKKIFEKENTNGVLIRNVVTRVYHEKMEVFHGRAF
jgi:ubiquinone/menaquinone biosynthesis C-methylase UbiE